MSNWDKNLFIDHLRNQCTREVAKVGVAIIEFTEKHADDISWGRGHDHGTLTYRCDTDVGQIPFFHMTSTGQLNLQINFMRNKEIPSMVIRDMVLKLESNFLRDYDETEYPSDVFVAMNELFHTENQVEKFLKTIEGCTYRLRQ